MNVVGCLGCDLLAGRRDLPGGIVHQTTAWVVNHVVGPMNLGTLASGDQPDLADVKRFCERARELFRMITDL